MRKAKTTIVANTFDHHPQPKVVVAFSMNRLAVSAWFASREAQENRQTAPRITVRSDRKKAKATDGPRLASMTIQNLKNLNK